MNEGYNIRYAIYDLGRLSWKRILIRLCYLIFNSVTVPIFLWQSI